MRKLKLFSLLMLLIVGVGHLWATDVVGTINFGSASGRTAVNSTSVTGEDSQGNEWTITTVMSENSFTQNAEYSQVGASKKPATSITFTTTLPAEQTIKSFSAKFGGFSGTAGTVTLKVGETSVGTGSLNATNDVTVNATNTTTSGTVLTVTVTGISKGVKCYYISYTYDGGGAPDPVLESIVITGNPDKVVYEAGESFDPTGLVATGYYDNSTDVDITSSVTWAYTPAGALTQGLTSVNVTATSGNVVGNKDVNITVNEHTVTPGEYDIVPNNALWGTSYSGTASGVSSVSGTQNDITIALAKGTSTNNMYINNLQSRAYNGYTMTFSVPAGYVITAVAFSADGNNWAGDHTVDVGTMTDNKNWTGSAEMVTVTFKGTCRIAGITVTVDVAGAAPACTAPTITTQPIGATYTQNGAATALSVEAEACDKISGTLSYQWYSNETESNEGGVAVTGEEAATFTPSIAAVGVVYYYCVVSQGEASVATDAVAVTVEGPEVGVSFEKEEADYTDWTFNNIISQQTGAITAHTKTYYGTTHAQPAASMVTANKIAGPDQLSFYVSKTTTNNKASNWYVKVSSDGTDWNIVETQDAASMSQGEWVEVTADLSDYTNVYVGIFYEGSTAVRAIDDVILTTRSLASYPVIYNATPANGLLSVELNSVEIASGTDVTEGDVLDVILAADEGYIGSVTVTKTDGGNNVTEDVYNAATGKLTMPAYGITVTAAFVIGVEAPVFDVASGVYTSEQLILLTTATSGASIYYTMTTDGTTPEDPTTASTLYNATTGIELNARGTYKIKAVAYKNENYSTIASAEYTINLPYVFATVTELITYVTTNNLTELNDVTVTGVVSSIAIAYNSQYSNISFFISDDGQTTGNQLEGFRTKDATGITAASVLEAGDRVTLHGNYVWYNNTTHELAANNTIEAYTAKVLSSVVVSGTPDQTDYSAGDQFLTTGLVVTANYSNTGYSKVVTDDVTWETSLDNNVVTATGEVLVTATYNNMVSDPYAVNVTVSSKALTSIELSETAYTIYKEQTYTKPTVTAHFDDNSTEDITAIATDDAATAFDNTVAGPNTVTVSYTYGTDTKTAQYTVTVQAYANADDAPYTVTEALAIIEGFSSNSADEIVVAGTVSVENKDGNKNRYKISDGTNELLVYGGKGFNKANFTATNYPQIGDVVVVKGNVINYNGNTPEFATGKSYLLSQIRPVMLSVDNVTAFEVGTADMEEGDLTIDRNGSDGEITFASEDETVVTIVEGKLHAVAPGMAVITANMAATDNDAALNYAAVSTTFNVTVVGTLPRYAVTFTANGGMGDAPVMDNQLEGAVFNLPANTFTYAGHKFAGWNDGTNTYAAGAAYTMPAAEVAFTAQWDDVCAWATVYTSNVVFTGAGTSFETGSRVVIGDEEYDAQKVGASSKSGSVVVTVPAGAHTLHFHAVSWNTSDLTITAEGVSNMTQSSFDIKKDAGVKSSGTYILANDPIDQHFHFTFDPVAEPTQITFSKTAGSDYRFVMYGINQEGGPELKSLTIGGTPTTTAYEVGQSFSTDGLTVSAVYAIGGVDQEPVDVTSQVTWNINPTEFTLTSQTSVTVTASLETKTVSADIPVTVSETSTPGVTHTAIVVKKGDTYYAMGQNLSGGALNAVELEGVINGKIVNVDVDDRAAITWEVTITADGATYKAQNGKYLKGNGSNTTLSWSDVPFYWTWSDTYGCYAVDNSRSFYMYGNNTSDFKNYALVNFSNNASLCSSETMELNEYVDIDLTDKEFVVLRDGLTVGQLGTFCWQADIYEIEGAVFYEPEEKIEDGISFIESLKEGDVFPMGRPYLFQAEATEIRGLVSKTNTTVDAGTNHGMHGTFTDIIVNDPDIMIIYANKVRPSANNRIRANRAYIQRSELPAQADPTPAPGRRRLVLGREDAPTAIDNILMDAQNVQKVLIDGQLYIVREGKWYDVTGQQVR